MLLGPVPQPGNKIDPLVAAILIGFGIFVTAREWIKPKGADGEAGSPLSAGFWIFGILDVIAAVAIWSMLR